MDKKIGGIIKDTMGDGEKKAAVKSIKLKVKFQDYDNKKKELAEKKK